MGFTSGWDSRSSLIAHLVENDDHSTCVRNCYRGGIFAGVLWSVRKFTDSPKILIFCDVLKCHGGEWGYRDLTESMGPLYYSCPLTYLQMAEDVKNQNWRDKVVEYHREATERRENKKKKIA